MASKPAIKWSGSKRSQAKQIVGHFPNVIDTYYEPFVGGGSILYELMTDSSRQINNFICSDINKDLINLWLEIKDNKDHLISTYRAMWEELNKDDNPKRRNDYYLSIRKRFNEERNPTDFIFLNRTCTNGLIRYNGKGEFNTSFHFSRTGIVPETLNQILTIWSDLLKKHNVQFIHRSYAELHTQAGDLLYCDPPYFATKGMYYGKIDYDHFFEFLREQRAYTFLSFDGKRGEEDFTHAVPQDIYKEHIYISSGISSFLRMRTQQSTEVFESLYII